MKMTLTSFRSVIGLWESPDALAIDIGAGVSAARKWWQRDRIPSEWWWPILSTRIAKEAGLTSDMLTKLDKETADARS